MRRLHAEDGVAEGLPRQGLVARPARAANAVTRRGRRPPAADESVQRLAQIVGERVRSGRSTGIAAGMICADGRTRVFAEGPAGDGSAELDADSVFEIGSITKVFTGTLLVDMAQRGELRLDDPVADLLPAGVSVPSRRDRQITLADLAMHASGLPREATNRRPADPRFPYADYSVEQLYGFLDAHTLTRDPGARVEYSNLGVGLLGHALALRAGMSYEALVRDRILAPLQMTSTAITPTADMARRFQRGHDARGRLIGFTAFSTLAGAGALRSTVSDMLRFAAANLGDDGPLAEAMAAARAPRKRVALAMRIGLTWHVLGTRARTLEFHDGATNGFTSFLGLHPSQGKAIVVLANSRQSGVEDIGLHMLAPRWPLRPPPVERAEITLEPALLERYAGTYDLLGTDVRIACDADGLSAQLPGDPVDRLYPESKTRFFLKTMDAQVHFKRDLRGRVKGAVVHADGQRMPALRQRSAAGQAIR